MKNNVIKKERKKQLHKAGTTKIKQHTTLVLNSVCYVLYINFIVLIYLSLLGLMLMLNGAVNIN